jgi:tRNA nucleotidyltransferase (CCA-adding enzyme)
MVDYDLTPRKPYRPLRWPDAVLEIAALLADETVPIYIVGGAVRDAMLGRLVKDLDLATPGDAIAIAKRIANSFLGGALFVMDRERGVARAIIETMYGPLNVDVARFRGEAQDSLLADLRDRDFTLNAMAVDLQGDLSLVIDPLGGEGDIAKKVVRRCRLGVVETDRVRALRAIRQSTQLRFRVEPETLAEVRGDRKSVV